MIGKMRTVICLLRNDLRVHDNEVLQWAHRNGDHVIPLFCFDPDHYRGTYHFNFPKTGPHRAKFIHESVSNLRENLKKLNSDLVTDHSKPVDSIRRIFEECCQGQGAKVTELWGSTLFHRQDIPYKNADSIPNTYTQFRKEVESRGRVRPVIEMPLQLKPLPPDFEAGQPPSLEDLGVDHVNRDHRSAFPFSGGETTGLARLQDYLWGSHSVATYKETRNGLVGQNYSTKFSPW